MRIAKWYKLHKDGEFYFLFRDRCSFIPNEHATKLSSALRKLSKSSTQGSVNVKTDLADNEACVKSGVTSGGNSEEVVVEKVVQEGKNQAPADSKISAQREVKDVAESDSAVNLTHDIQIHVQRPSPIREGPGSRQKLFLVGTVPDLKDGERDVCASAVDAVAKECTSAQDLSVKSDNVEEPTLSSAASDVDKKVQEMDLHRVRPTSGPATVTCTERPEFSFVRKSCSVTNNLDEEGEDPGFVVHSRRSVGAICSVTQDPALRSFSRSKDSIRRIHSTVSFDRPSLKSLGSSFDTDEAADLSARSVAAQPAAQKGNVYGLRSRHTSGLETPMSTLDTSSVTSMGEAGAALLL